MNIYIFSLLVGYEISGVDHSIGTLHTFFKQLQTPLKYVFTEIPTNTALKNYTDIGIGYEDMICAQFSMTGNANIGRAQIQTRDFYTNGILTASEAATDRTLYIDIFSRIEKIDGSETRRSRRTFLKPDGSVAYDIIYDPNNLEQYVFPNGETCSKGEFMLKFIQSLCLSEDDLIIIHRPGNMNFVEPLFLSKQNAHILVFFHSGHDFLPGEDPYFNYLNPAYYYFFEHADKLTAILVSTQEQKKDVLNTIENYHFPKTNIEVLPVFGVNIRREVKLRKPFSLLSVSRLDQRKHVDLLIRASIEAHKLIPELTLDIYGTGSPEYISMLKALIESAQASSYITLKGYCDVSNIYDNYEAYITTSTWETFGITLLEAINSGNAMIGFRARYGNPLFIKPGENGYLVDVDFSRLEDEQYRNCLAEELARNIQLLFADSERLKHFHKASYELAKTYSIDKIGKKWINYLSDISTRSF